MIKLKDSLITDGLPDCISDEPRTQALAYAINRQLRKVLTYSDEARVYDGFRECPEVALDMIANELKIPLYKDAYDIETKRKMVANSFLYWCRMGTVYAMEQLCTDLFKDAKVTEWFDYDGEPGHFRIEVEGFKVTQADVNKFIKDLRRIKRLSAHLDSLGIKMNLNLSGEDKLRVGILPITIGRKLIGISAPDGYKKTLNTGVVYMQGGKKKIGISAPDDVKVKAYHGVINIISGKKYIGGIR